MSVISFKYDLPLDQTMAFEAVYPESQRLDLSQKQQIRDAPGSIFVWMFMDGELAGETYGIPLESSIAGLTDLSDSEKKSGIHCYSNTMLPVFQGRGLGKILKAHWLGLAVARGFEAVYGYARPGASQRLNASFGAVFLGAFPDWCGAGEEYQMYRLALTTLHKNAEPKPFTTEDTRSTPLSQAQGRSGQAAEHGGNRSSGDCS